MLFTVEHFDVCPKKAASVVPRYHNRLELSEACFSHKENRLSFQAMARRHLLPFWLTDPKCVISKKHRCLGSDEYDYTSSGPVDLVL